MSKRQVRARFGGIEVARSSPVRTRSFFLFFALTLVFASNSRGDGAILTVWNYAGQSSFSNASLMSMKKNGPLFEMARVGEISSTTHPKVLSCKNLLALRPSLLNYNQSFSLSLMADSNYLTRQAAELQASALKDVEPDQVKFTEISEIVPKSMVPQDPRVIHEARRGQALKSVFALNSRTTTEMKKSAMWTVSAQTLGPNGVEKRKMLWQNDPELKDDPRLAVDREKYKFAWEIGRAGKMLDGNVQENIRALVTLAYQEMKHLGADPFTEEGYIFMHALNPTRTKLFERWGGERFPIDWKNENNCVLVAKLSDLLLKYAPRSISQRVNRVIELSNGRLGDRDALKLLDANLIAFRTDLDLHLPGDLNTRGPIIMEDMSLLGYRSFMEATLKNLDLTAESRSDLLGYLARILHTEESVSSVYTDAALVRNGWNRFAKQNSVHVSNLNESIAAENPIYLKSVLAGIPKVYAQRLQRAGVADSEAIIRKQKIGYAIRTESAYISNELRKLGSRQQTVTVGNRWGLSQKIYLHFFTAEQVQAMGAASGSLSEGYWARRRLLAHPMQF
jgi:hypothetical protein